MITYVSVFSGIGGFDLGFDRAGMICKTQVEFNEAASGVLAHHWPYAKRFKDVRDVGKHNLPAVDLICGGFPCQDVSVAGCRAGLAGERSGLWFEFLRIITELAPRWVVIENVPGLLSSNRGRDFATIIQGLVKCGYGVCWRVLDAQYFGLAQRRRRVFIVGHLGDGRAAEILFERESGGGNPAESGEARQGAAGEIGNGVESYRNYGFGQYTSSNHKASTLRSRDSKDVSDLVLVGTLGAEMGRNRGLGQENETSFLVPVSELSPTLTNLAKGASEDGNGRHAFVIAEAVDARNLRSNGDISGTLQAKKSGGYSLSYQNPIAFQWDASVSQTMSAIDDQSPPLKTKNSPAISKFGYGVRRLTPLECERLQGFPDGWTAVNGQSDSERYRQLGNAAPVNVTEWVGWRIEECELRHWWRK